ncbi:MAG: site-2 protease family protein [Clostridia bacterium]|nr:site-2 protease family protein [Clostridia bacterium]
MNYIVEQVFYYLSAVIAVLFVFVPHEFAHAYAAYRNGDYTPKYYGRLTLNPVKHFDLMGFLLCVLAGFGWAKPVPINPVNFRKYKKGLFETAIAGVCTNYVIAFIVYPLFLVVERFIPGSSTALIYVKGFIGLVLYRIYLISLSIIAFNLLPLFPLDGFRIVESCTSPYNRFRLFLQKYGRYILMGLIIESFVCNILYQATGIGAIQYLNILGFYLQWFAQHILGAPIWGLWNWIFSLF